MSRTSHLPTVGVFLVLALTAGAGWAQRGAVRGTVVDADGNPLSGVQVTVSSEQLPSFHHDLQTDEDGQFTVRFLSNQTQYRFQFLLEKPGYQSVVEELSPSAVRQSRQEFVLEASKTRAVERHGDLTSVVTGSTNVAIEAFNEGLTAQRAGDLDTARAKFEGAIAADPSLGPAHVALSQVLLDQKRYAAAVESADKALALDTGHIEALGVKYEALRAQGKKDEAEAVAAELESVEDAVASARRIYNEGGEVYQAGDVDTALEKFRQAAELDPSLVEAQHAIATLELAQGRPEAAAEAAEKALALGSDDLKTLRVLYDAYQALGRVDELTEIAPRLAAVDPEFGGAKLVEQAAERWNAGQTAEAAALARQALAIDPSLAKAHYFLGLDHLSKGENAEARKSLERFLELAPDDPEAATAREMLGYIEQ
jgi:tetratricopeptide (TPR) repeat protein